MNVEMTCQVPLVKECNVNCIIRTDKSDSKKFLCAGIPIISCNAFHFYA